MYGLAKNTARGLFFILLTLIAYLALTPVSHSASTLCWDKINHLAAYFCLGVIADMAFRTGERLFTKILLLLAYSALIETAQRYIPARQFELYDILTNALGLLLAATFIHALKKTKFYQFFR